MTYEHVVWGVVAAGVLAAGLGVAAEAAFRIVRGIVLLPHEMKAKQGARE